MSAPGNWLSSHSRWHTRRTARRLRTATPRGPWAGAESLERRTLLAAFTGDGFGYVADPAPGESVDLVPGGDGVVSLLADGEFDSTPLDLGGNTFSFYGQNYTGADALYVSPHGVITFGGALYTFYNSDLTYSPELPSIAALWDQWSTGFGPDDQVLARFDNTDADPEPDRLVVEWNGVQNYYNQYYGSTSQSPVTFQAILSINTGNDPGDIVLNYPDTDTGDYYQSDGGTAVVGIKDAGYQQSNRLMLSYYPAYYGGSGVVGSGQAVRVYWDGNDAPAADAGGPYSAVEGWFTLLDASASADAQQPFYTLTYEWDLDGDGAFGEYVGGGAMNGNEVGYVTEFDAFGLHAGDVHTVTLRVTDGGGLDSTDTAQITITENQVPEADAGPWWADSYTVVEGRYTLVSAANSWDPEQGNYLDYVWNLDGDNEFGEFEGAGGDNGSEVGIETYFFAGNLSAGAFRTITVRATDRAGDDDEDTANVNVVANQAPAVNIGGPYVAKPDRWIGLNAGGTYDPDEGLNWDAFQWDLDGDGQYGETYWNGGDPERGDEVGPYPTFYTGGLSAGDTFTIFLRVTDSGGLVGEASASVEIVPPLPPVADAGPPAWLGETYTVPEGGSLYLSAADSFDPDGDFIDWYNFWWDLDGDGVFGEWGGARGAEVGRDVYFYASGLDGPLDYPVSVMVTDQDGMTDVDTTLVRILPVTAYPVIRGSPASSQEGIAIVFESTVYNVASFDAVGYAWTVTKDGEPDPYAIGTLPSFSFVPYEDGNYRVTLVVTEADGTSSDLTPDSDQTIVVTNTPPTLNGISVDSPTVDEGGTVTLTGSYNDPGAADGHTVTIDWGDGSVETLDLGGIGPNLPLAAPRQFNGHTYYAIQFGQLTWEQAQAEAQRLGGHLVTIGSAEENSFVTDYARFVYGDQGVWIGLNDAAAEGSFAWVSGEDAGYTNWNPGEPNDYPTFGGEDFAELRLWARNADGGMWNDLPVGGTLGTRINGAIIEFPGAPVGPPAPTFTATHRYADSGQYEVTASLTDDDGAAARLPRGLVQWRASDGGNGHYYLLTDGPLFWPDAEAQAVAQGGHLASILSAEENAFLVGHFIQSFAPYTIYWMGFNDTEVEGDWRWTSGEPADYTNWHYNEPNNFGGNQDYGTFNYHFLGDDPAGLWDDDGTVLRPGIVELESPPAGLLPALTVTVNNVAPVITAASSDAAGVGDKAAGQNVTLSVSFTDAGADTHTLTVDWGDGSTTAGNVSEVLGSGSGSAGHAYAAGGVYTVVLTVADDDGASASRSLTVYVTGARVHNGQLQVVGSAGADHSTIRRLDNGTILVEGGPGAGTSAPDSAVLGLLILLGDGDDMATVDASVTDPVTVLAGRGNDQVKGANGTNVFVGGDGNDLLIGGSGRDLLIGGDGADRLLGNGGDDILVAGRTSHDSNSAALAALISDWAGRGTLQQRITRLTAGVGGFALNASTVSDDAAPDVLTGAAGGDWFAVSASRREQINDLTSIDRVLDVT